MATLKQLDPSRTAGIQRMYSAELIRRLNALKKATYISIAVNDAFGLRPGILTLAVIPPAGPKQWATLDAAAKQRAFQNWLGNALAQMLDDNGGPAPAWLKTFVRAAYSKGIASATGLLEKGRKDIQQAVNQVLNTPFHRERLEGIFERNFTELKGFTQSMATKLQRILADGLAQGANPIAMARDISAAIDISKNRARAIARTETIRTNAEATLNTFERFGVSQVQVEAEWLTAEDGRVCPLCAAHNRKIYTIEQARGMIPLHVSCRCAWISVVNDQSQTA